MNLDGEPIWSPIKENDLKFAVNTNWDLFQHEPTKTFYLRNDEHLAEGRRPRRARGRRPAQLPESFTKLPADDNWKDVKAALPGKKLAADKAPKVFVSTTPAELILLTGAPKYVPVAGHVPALGQQHRERRVPDGQDGRRLLPGRRAAGSRRPDFTGPWTFATPNAAGGLPEDPARAPALARARVGARHAAGGRGRAARADSADGARQQEGAEGARGRVPGRAEVRADREDDGRSARSTPTRTSSRSATSTTCASRASGSCRKSADRPMGGHRHRCRRRSTRSRSARPSYNVTYVTVAGRTTTSGSTFATAAAYTGVMVAWGCAVWGTGWYYPPYWGCGGGYPVLLPALPELRLRRLVQPVDRRLRPRRRGLRSVRRRRRRRALQPADRHVLARRRGLRSLRRARRGAGLQPAHRHLRRRRARARTSTAAGAAPPCSAATSGRRPRA